MASIDVGIKVLSLNVSLQPGVTQVNKDNPANLTGKITTFDIHCYNNVTGLIVAIFQNVGGSNLTARDSQSIGALGTGLHEGIVVDLDIEAGDYIGWYNSGGNIYGGGESAGYWYLSGDQTECVNATFSAWANEGYLWGDGGEVGAEYYERSAAIDVGIAPTADRRCVYHRYGWRP